MAPEKDTRKGIDCTMIVLIAQHFAKEGNEEEVAAALREMSAYCNSDEELNALYEKLGGEVVW